MKILLYCSFGRHKITHLIALGLKARYPAARFAVVTFRDSIEGRYLRHDTDNLFEEILCESELLKESQKSGYVSSPAEIQRLESLYGKPTLWQFVTHDRRLSMTLGGWLYQEGSPFSRPQLLSILQTRFTGIEKLLDSFQPDFVLYAEADTGPGSAHALHAIASKRSIPTWVPHRSRVGSYLILSEEIQNRFPQVEKCYHAIRAGELPNSRKDEAREILRQFREGGGRYRDPNLPQHSAATPGKKASRSQSTLNRILTYPKRFFQGSYSNDPYMTPWLARKRDDLLARYRKLRISHNAFGSKIDADARFVYFPLHVQPEMSTLLFAPFHTDQLPLIRNLAQSLPCDTELYCKEHPASLAKGLRPISVIRELQGMPNVRLMLGDPHEIIEKCQAVVTITGTPAFEALLLGKPVITVGNLFINFLKPLVWHATDHEALPGLIADIPNFKSDDAILADFLCALLEESAPVDLDQLFFLTRNHEPADLLNHPILEAYLNYLSTKQPLT